MARKPREYSESGLYHVIIRGINREKIFESDCEKLHFLKILKRNFSRDGVKIKNKKYVLGQLFAFCILDNHVHLLLKEGDLGISNLMQRITTAYALYFNHRHGRSGPVFESRYTSRPVEGDRYFSNVLKYIHNNPVAACVVKKSEEYSWSSMFYYVYGQSDFLEAEVVMGNLSIEEFKAAMALPYSEDSILRCKWPKRISDFQILVAINQLCKTYGVLRQKITENLQLLTIVAAKLSTLEGITKVQLARHLGISAYKLTRILTSP